MLFKKKEHPEGNSLKVKTAFIITLTYLLAFVGYYSAPALPIPVAGASIGLSLAFLAGTVLFETLWDRRSKRCLSSRESIYLDQLATLHRQSAEIEDAKTILCDESDTEQEQKRHRVLELKEEAVNERKTHFSVLLQRIELVRWGWGLQRMTRFLDIQDYMECRERLTSLEKLLEQGKHLLAKWQQHKALLAHSEGARNLHMLKAALHFGAGWVDALRDKLVELAAGPTSHLTYEEVSTTGHEKEEFDQFMHLSVSNILSTRDDLNKEFHRLRLDKSSAMQLEDMTSHVSSSEAGARPTDRRPLADAAPVVE